MKQEKKETRIMGGEILCMQNINIRCGNNF